MKGQVLADFLAAHPISDDSPLACEFPDEEVLNADGSRPTWEMYFDGASSIRPSFRPKLPTIRAGIGLVFVTPKRGIIRHAFMLTEPCTNNEAEYEALIAGLEMAIHMGIRRLKVYGDSQLILSQVAGEFKVLKPELIRYHERTMELIDQIPEVILEKATRAENGRADALARVAKELGSLRESKVHITIRNRKPLSLSFSKEDIPEAEKEIFFVEELSPEINLVAEDEEDWRTPFIEYFKHGVVPKEKGFADQLKKRVLRYVYTEDTLYRRSYDQL